VARRILILANPVAGGGRSRSLAPELRTALQRHGLQAELFFSVLAGDLAARATAAGKESWDAIVAVGGDGTVLEILNGMPDPTRPLGVLPVGTANVLACEYRLPTRPSDVAAVVAAGRTRRHAIGLASGRRFLLFCGAGIDGAVVERMQQVRSGTLGKRGWLLPILHVVRRWPAYDLRVELPNGDVIEGLSSVLVTRVRNYGGILRLVPGIDPGEDLLHVMCFRQRRRVAWMWLGARALLRCLQPSPRLQVFPSHALRIAGAAPFQIDGDYGGTTPVSIALAPAPANLLAP
jgi:diacylglycerol kinase family enzyme